ncbi:serine hydrolase domain-containing protein [Kitasatospora sp. NPDC097691]|uniref:serine hydrolase domain-containing protein n=1 Tax=Kitasatospora sp. NPDC097691 TaxID=3157231 RepID=UPI0033171A70
MTSETMPTDRATATAKGRRRRLPLAGLACMALTAVVLSAAAPALAAPAGRPAAVVAAREVSLPKLNVAALQAAAASAPATTTAMLARVSGPAGHWTGTSGVADVTTREAVPVDGRFRLGSVTKMFIGTVVLQLAAEDRIELDRPVQKYLPDVLPADYPPISVRQLLDYTSGLPELTAGDLPTDPQGIVDHRLDDHSFGELVAMAVKHPRLFDQPGTMQSYGATGYYVAAMLVEQLTGRSYQQEITDRILLPLDLRHTTAPETDPTIPGPHAHGYIDVSPAHDKSGLVDITEQNPGAGGMISTTADLDRFLTALFRGRLLPPAQLDAMFTVPDVPYLGGSDQDPGHGRAFYGAGPMRVTLPDGVTVWGKTGSTFGYTDGMFATRDLKRRLVYSFNPVTGGGNDRRLVNQIISAAFNS